MKKLTCLAPLFVLLALFLPGGLRADKPEFTDAFALEDCTFKTSGRNPHFILEPGYLLVLEGEEEGESIRLEIMVLHETAVVAGVATRVVTETEFIDNELAEISRNYVALCEQTNSVFYFGEDVDVYEDGEIVSHEGAWKAGENGARPGLLMPGAVQAEARYFQELAPGVAMDRAEIVSLSEVVDTPAGLFEGVVKIEETTPLEPEDRDFKFYATGVGLVQDSALKLVRLPELLAASPPPSFSTAIPLTVPEGTVLQVALAEETRLKEVGQPLRGLLVEPLYAYDEEVVPVGSEVWGRVAEIGGVSRTRRIFSALNANFSPARGVRVEFDEIVLPDGTRLPLKAAVTPGSGRTIKLITTTDNEKKKTVKDAAANKMKEAIREAKNKWESAMDNVKKPGKLRRLKRFGLEQLPVHPQYIDAGTVYFMELQEPLRFGKKPLPVQTAATREAALPPCNLLAHAQLLTPLNSATTERDAPVEAILTRPLFSGDRLVYPQGTRLRGSVVHVRRARRLGRSGQLQVGFRELIPPNGFLRQMVGNLEGVQSSQEDNVKIDVEGGTKTAAPKRRYLSMGIAVALAVTAHKDSDVGDDNVGASNSAVSASSSGAKEGIAGGAGGFKLVGMIAGGLIQSQPFALGMGLYGIGRTGYTSFVARGSEVVFPRGTAMEIGFSFRENCVDSAPAEQAEKEVPEVTTRN